MLWFAPPFWRYEWWLTGSVSPRFDARVEFTFTGEPVRVFGPSTADLSVPFTLLGVPERILPPPLPDGAVVSVPARRASVAIVSRAARTVVPSRR